jgi:hypothetical protein
MLKSRGVEDVNQLSGWIHRDLEKNGNNGYLKGVNFTLFVESVAINPSFLSPTIQGNRSELSLNGAGRAVSARYKMVQCCVECGTPFDKLVCSSRVCTASVQRSGSFLHKMSSRVSCGTLHGRSGATWASPNICR